MKPAQRFTSSSGPPARSSREQQHRGPSAVHIAAINWSPPIEKLIWTTTDTALEGVLDEIESGLAAGKVVQPVGAVYSGSGSVTSHRSRTGFVYPDVPVAALDSVRQIGVDAYELVDRLPSGRARAAAWMAFALQTYGDKLLVPGDHPDFVSQDTAVYAGRLFSLAGGCHERASKLAVALEPNPGMDGPHRLPRWVTVTRSYEQLLGMREALDTLRTHVAHDLSRMPPNNPAVTLASATLATLDERIVNINLLWIPHAPAELRRGIGDALMKSLDTVYALGQTVAAIDSPRA